MNTINTNYNPNFTGIKLDVSKVTKNKQRWDNIAKIIEQRASKVKSNDNVEIYSIENGNGIYIDVDTFAKTGKGSNHQIEAIGVQLDNIMIRPDKYIAGKIIKFVKLCRKQDKTYNALNDFIRKTKSNEDDDFSQKLTDLVVNKVVDEQKEIIAKDNLLSKINCYI